MFFDPFTGKALPTIQHVFLFKNWLAKNPAVPVLYNPWTGQRRSPASVMENLQLDSETARRHAQVEATLKYAVSDLHGRITGTVEPDTLPLLTGTRLSVDVIVYTPHSVEVVSTLSDTTVLMRYSIQGSDVGLLLQTRTGTPGCEVVVFNFEGIRELDVKLHLATTIPIGKVILNAVKAFFNVTCKPQSYDTIEDCLQTAYVGVMAYLQSRDIEFEVYAPIDTSTLPVVFVPTEDGQKRLILIESTETKFVTGTLIDDDAYTTAEPIHWSTYWDSLNHICRARVYRFLERIDRGDTVLTEIGETDV